MDYDNGDEVENRANQIKEQLEKNGAILLGTGRHRMVLKISESEVVKLPICPRGISDNSLEAIRWEDASQRKDPIPIPLAKCRESFIEDFPILFMEYVEPTRLNLKDLPTWCSFVDCYQVGLTKDGRLVAYDYA